ncbi:MAG TPA: thioredoxin-disulfide reductase [Sandaracinaceae bacterium LLY-WYZ-13_1]|nr:thioredoxin-disulfide reductase [Sandaracinaceae bacterium LLY-WYZ-13_1]
MPRNVIIIGSGPAGLTAAIYAARANLNPLCIEGQMMDGMIPGGQLMFTTDVENYPGFPEGVTGPDMMKKFRDQAARFGTEIITADVDRVDFSERPYKVYVGDDEYVGHAIIISTGASARWLGLESEEKLKNRGVSACATCDGYFFRDQDVCVVGGGDTAMEEALYLAGLCRSVTVIHRRDELRASKIMQERAFKNPKIEFLWDSVVADVLDVDAGEVTGVKVKHVKSGEEHVKDCTGLFVAIGHIPSTKVFRDWLECDDQGYLITQPDSTRTSLEGVYASGDVQDKIFRQAVTAAGTGCMAAIEAERWLAENELTE